MIDSMLETDYAIAKLIDSIGKEYNLLIDLKGLKKHGIIAIHKINNMKNHKTGKTWDRYIIIALILTVNFSDHSL